MKTRLRNKIHIYKGFGVSPHSVEERMLLTRSQLDAVILGKRFPDPAILSDDGCRLGKRKV